MTEEILKGNKLIAEFMDYKIIKNRFEKERSYTYNGDKHETSLSIKEVYYNSSWDWLMPVVEKIEKNFEVTISDIFCKIILSDGEGYATGIIKKDAETKIKATWMAVVCFVKWYNYKSISVSPPKENEDNGHGICIVKNCKLFAEIDYNGHGYWVCKDHFDSLNRYFDEEFK